MALLVDKVDWAGLVICIGFPLYYWATQLPFSAKEQAYYNHLTRNSCIYPRGGWQAIFGIAWTILYPAVGVASYLFWRFADSTRYQYDLGLAMHWIGLLLNFLWYNLFFRRRMPKTTFVVTLLILACAVGFFACSIVLGRVAEPILYGFYMGWLIFATIMTIVAAFVVPEYDDDKFFAVNQNNAAPIVNKIKKKF